MIFISELKDLTQTDKLFDVKMKLAKDKALEKSKRFKREAKIKIKKLPSPCTLALKKILSKNRNTLPTSKRIYWSCAESKNYFK